MLAGGFATDQLNQSLGPDSRPEGILQPRAKAWVLANEQKRFLLLAKSTVVTLPHPPTFAKRLGWLIRSITQIPWPPHTYSG